MSRRRESVKIASLVALSALALVAAPFLGPPLPEGSSDFIFWQLRVPRTLMAALVGGTLSLVGAVYQTLFFNPLAAPSTVGTTAGAMLGALAAIVYGIACSLAASALSSGMLASADAASAAATVRWSIGHRVH